MFNGDKINRTEDRAVLRTALRGKHCPDKTINQQVEQELRHMQSFSEQLRAGAVQGYTGRTITDIVCLGVGGSNLGPQTVIDALLQQPEDRLNLHFISSVDAVPLEQLLASLDIETTLFIISSKTFTTTETLLNAEAGKRWLLNQAPESAVAQHFVAVTEDIEKAQAFGVVPSCCFTIHDWVGGRFSLWSAMSLPIAIARGFKVFASLLAGARAMDDHF